MTIPPPDEQVLEVIKALLANHQTVHQQQSFWDTIIKSASPPMEKVQIAVVAISADSSCRGYQSGAYCITWANKKPTYPTYHYGYHHGPFTGAYIFTLLGIRDAIKMSPEDTPLTIIIKDPVIYQLFNKCNDLSVISYRFQEILKPYIENIRHLIKERKASITFRKCKSDIISMLFSVASPIASLARIHRVSQRRIRSSETTTTTTKRQQRQKHHDILSRMHSTLFRPKMNIDVVQNEIRSAILSNNNHNNTFNKKYESLCHSDPVAVAEKVSFPMKNECKVPFSSNATDGGFSLPNPTSPPFSFQLFPPVSENNSTVPSFGDSSSSPSLSSSSSSLTPHHHQQHQDDNNSSHIDANFNKKDYDNNKGTEEYYTTPYSFCNTPLLGPSTALGVSDVNNSNSKEESEDVDNNNSDYNDADSEDYYFYSIIGNNNSINKDEKINQQEQHHHPYDDTQHTR
ncbi:hypothetical protein BDA99DRAFT_608951 [Phascolomyces articulosus]|uniref:Uncharacterized protein n=1 Tax=Phascolomyces articulosus TaxID=60185 RepID=A0AAD5K2P9_9FUNG|nr:hypothetical protein BDA99DRAFT_608951 [Phascolomyces articulosus]